MQEVRESAHQFIPERIAQGLDFRTVGGGNVNPEAINSALSVGCCRTSIILGGLPKTCSAERFLHSMKSCHLITKLRRELECSRGLRGIKWAQRRFFYLPVEKTRGRAVGYIFMDFQHASDVLDFWTRLRELCDGIGGLTGSAAGPAAALPCLCLRARRDPVCLESSWTPLASSELRFWALLGLSWTLLGSFVTGLSEFGLLQFGRPCTGGPKALQNLYVSYSLIQGTQNAHCAHESRLGPGSASFDARMMRTRRN